MADNNSLVNQPNQPQELSLQETYDLLGDDSKTGVEQADTLEVKKSKGKDTELEVEEEPVQEEDLLEGDEEDKPEKLELITLPRRREILKEFPTLFKKFPQLEHAFYREQKFTEIYPSLEDAREAKDRSDLLGDIESQVFTTGKLTTVIQKVQENDKEAFKKLVDYYLPSLMEVDSQAYLHVLANVISETIKSMWDQGTAESNDDLKTAAGILNKFVFNSDRYRASQRLSTQVNNPEVDKVKAEKEALAKERFDSAREQVATRIDNILVHTINVNIDRNDTLTEYEKKNAVRDCLGGVHLAISQDKRFKQTLDNLWKKAAAGKYKQSDMDDIRNAYTTQSKVILRQLIPHVRNQVLRGRKSTAKDNDEKIGMVKPGRSAGPQDSGDKTRNYQKKSDIKPGESSLDYLLRD